MVSDEVGRGGVFFVGGQELMVPMKKKSGPESH